MRIICVFRLTLCYSDGGCKWFERDLQPISGLCPQRLHRLLVLPLRLPRKTRRPCDSSAGNLLGCRRRIRGFEKRWAIFRPSGVRLLRRDMRSENQRPERERLGCVQVQIYNKPSEWRIRRFIWSHPVSHR